MRHIGLAEKRGSALPPDTILTGASPMRVAEVSDA
jgi:hypothetical protein